MKSKIFIQQELLQIEEYKDGCVGLLFSEKVNKILNTPLTGNLIVRAHIKCSQGLLALFYLLDTIEYQIDIKFKVALILPFLPNARQDRMTSDIKSSKPFTLASFSRILNSYTCITNIHSLDVHSNVPFNLMPRLKELDQVDLYTRLTEKFEDLQKTDILISPDLGALKKIQQLSTKLKIPFGIALKRRDPISNEILETKILEADVKNKQVTIVDDILDGGRTFIPLATILKKLGATKVNLVVTHGLFSYGAEQLKGDIDNIYTYSSWLSEEEIIATKGFVKTLNYY